MKKKITCNSKHLLFLIILTTLYSFTSCFKKFLQNKKELKKEDKIKFGQMATKFQVGKLNLIPDGPMTEEELHDFLSREKQKQEGSPSNVGVVYIDRRIADMPVGQTRIKPKNMVLYFPDDYEDVKNYQNEDDNDIYKREQHDNRIKLEREILNKAEDYPHLNPYKEIYDKENEFLDYESDVKPDVQKKNLLNLAVNKEEEIFRKELKNENDEYFDKKFNKGFFNNVYNFRKSWYKEHPQKEEKEKEPEPVLDYESQRIIKTFELK